MEKSFLEITSTKNPHFQAARALASTKGRREQQAFLCEGEHLVEEAVALCPQKVRSVFVCHTKAEEYHHILSALPQAGVSCYKIPERLFSSLSQVKAPQGIAAVVALPQIDDVAQLCQSDNPVVLLEHVQDPGNVGTILRTIDAAGFGGCILAGNTVDPFSPKALRATMGSIFRVPLAIAQDGAAAAEGLKACGYAVVAAVLGGAPFYERKALGNKVCVAIGNEGAGLSPHMVAAATHHYQLPMQGGAESLNAAVAAAVMMYDMLYRC